MKSQSNNIKNYIGLRIKFIRNIRHLTIVSIADRLGVTRKQFQNYERGKTDLRVSCLDEIAKSLNVSASVLLEGYDEDSNLSDSDKNFLINYSRIKSKDIRKAISGLLSELV